jgi:hypothetical protein
MTLNHHTNGEGENSTKSVSAAVITAINHSSVVADCFQVLFQHIAAWFIRYCDDRVFANVIVSLIEPLTSIFCVTIKDQVG